VKTITCEASRYATFFPFSMTSVVLTMPCVQNIH